MTDVPTRSPLVCLHGFLDTPRTWDLVLPMLQRRHDVLTPTLPGHAGGPPLPESLSLTSLTDAIERVLDGAGLDMAHLAGNSLGGYLALRLAARGRARSVVAFAPAGGWAPGDSLAAETFERQHDVREAALLALPHVDAIVASRSGRRQATRLIVERFEHIPPDLVAELVRGVAGCERAAEMLEAAAREGWGLDVEQLTCPVRIVWGAEDRLLPWPAAAVRFRESLPHADWIVLDGVGHAPQLDVPLEAAQLILGFTER